MDNNTIDANAQYEVCVSCGKLTDVLKTTPIELRDYYLPDGGQLCHECGSRIFQKGN